MKIAFVLEKETKNTMRFQEVLATNLDTAKVGTLYVQKSCLKEIGYKDGQQIEIEISTKAVK